MCGSKGISCSQLARGGPAKPLPAATAFCVLVPRRGGRTCCAHSEEDDHSLSHLLLFKLLCPVPSVYAWWTLTRPGSGLEGIGVHGRFSSSLEDQAGSGNLGIMGSPKVQEESTASSQFVLKLQIRCCLRPRFLLSEFHWPQKQEL